MGRGRTKTATELDENIGQEIIVPKQEIPKCNQPWWSEELHKSHLLVKYWKTKQLFTRQGEPNHKEVQKREQELVDIDIYQGDK